MNLPGNIFLRTCMEILCCISINSWHHQAWWQSVWKCWLVASCFYNSKCLQVFVSTLSACLPNLAIPDYYFWAISKVRYTEHVLPVGDELKQWIQECIKRISKEMPQCVMTAFILWLQECTEQHGGHLQIVIININFISPGVYLLVWIKIFHYALKCYFI